MTSNYIKEKKAAMTWTMYVMEAVGRAREQEYLLLYT